MFNVFSVTLTVTMEIIQIKYYTVQKRALLSLKIYNVKHKDENISYESRNESIFSSFAAKCKFSDTRHSNT